MKNRPTLKRIEERIKTIPWYEVGQEAVKSIHMNFDVGGRPKKWKKRKQNQPWPILKRTSKLKFGHHIYTVPDGVIISNNVIYAAVHNYGGKKRRIPKRKFLLLQENDKKLIRDKIKRHITS